MDTKIDLIVHGIPCGQKSFGNNENESQFIKGFYHPYKYERQMIVESHQSNSATLMWYTFIANGTTDVESRAGGYFGLSIKMNQFYSDFANMYNVLDALFSKFFVGEVLKKEQNGYRFLKKDFDSAAAIIKSANEEVRNYLMQFSVNEDYKPVFSTNSSSQSIEINPRDCTDRQRCEQWFKQYGKLTITSLCPLLREMGYRKEKDELAKQLSDSQNKILQHEKTIKDLQTELNRVKSEQSSIIEIKAKLDKCEQEKSKLKDKLEKMSGILSDIPAASKFPGSAENKGNSTKSNKPLTQVARFLPLANSVLCLLLFLCLCLSLKLVNKNNAKDAKVSNVELQTKEFQYSTTPDPKYLEIQNEIEEDYLTPENGIEDIK